MGGSDGTLAAVPPCSSAQGGVALGRRQVFQLCRTELPGIENVHTIRYTFTKQSQMRPSPVVPVRTLYFLGSYLVVDLRGMPKHRLIVSKSLV